MAARDGAGAGAVLRDAQGNDIVQGGIGLETLASIDISGTDKRLSACHIEVACDVTNSYRQRGRVCGFGPQKGATPEMIERPDTALTRYAHLIARDLHVDVLIWQAAARQAAWGGVIRVLRRAATAWY